MFSLKKLLKNPVFKNLFLYGLIGIVAFVIDYSLFSLCHKYFEMNEYIANLVGMNVGAVFSFTCNTFINFKKTDRLIRRFLTYYFVILLGMGLSTIILALWGKENIQIGKVVAMVIVSIFQFIFNKIFTFKH